MPKQVHKMEHFHGGLSTNSDPRDIAEEEVSTAVDIMVDEIGKIRMMGGIATHDVAANVAVISAGYGLFQFSQDRTVGAGDGVATVDSLTANHSDHTPGEYLNVALTGGTGNGVQATVVVAGNGRILVAPTITRAGAGGYVVNDTLTILSSVVGGGGNEAVDVATLEAVSETGDDYLAMADTDSAANIDIYSRTFGGWGAGIIDLGSTTGMLPSFYVAGGAIRVSDGNFGANNQTKWYGYVHRRFFGDGSTGFDDDDYAQGLLVSTWHQDEAALKSLAVKDFYGGGQANGTDPDISSPISVQFEGTTSHNQDVRSSGTIAGDTQSIRVTVAFSASEPNVTALTNTTPGFDTFCNAGDHILVEDADDAGNNRIFKVKGVQSDDTDPNVINFEEAVTACTSDDCYMYNLTRSSWFNSENTGWECAVSTLYDDSKQESPLSIASSTLEPDDIVATLYNMSEMSINLHVFAGDGASTGLALIHSRVSGFKIYMRRANTSTWYLQKEVDVTKGIRTPGQGDYIMWDDCTIMGGESAPAEGTNESSPREIETYEGETGHDSSTTNIGFDGVGTGYKTAVVTNRTAYVGNVRIPDWKGDIRTYGDAILKSQVNKFDSFTFERRIEVEISDGDEIIKLEEYADRILQFKKNKMQLINVSQEIEFLEDSFMHKGVSHQDATCKTDFGIAWVNNFGCYLYDGQNVNNLLEKGGRQVIRESDWNSFITDNSTIGYIPKKRQLIVLKDCTASSSGDIFLYDIVTQSWSKGDSKFTDSQIQTNFVTDWNGDLVNAHTSGTGTIEKWDDAGDASSRYSVITKDIDFGQPAVRKKIYKVYLTFKGNAAHVQVHYGVDGLSPASTFFPITGGSDGTSTGTGATAKCIPYDAGITDWLKAELRPGASINNVNSFQLKISGDGSNAISSDFEINDISIVFRLKNVR